MSLGPDLLNSPGFCVVGHAKFVRSVSELGNLNQRKSASKLIPIFSLFYVFVNLELMDEVQ